MPTTFATVLNCMDGRVQRPVGEYLLRRFGVDCVDSITEAGLVRFLADAPDAPETISALEKVRISMGQHGSSQIAVVGHVDCAGNPVDDETHLDQVRRARAFLKSRFPACEVLGLWVDEAWTVREVPPASA
jgi:hypothetical protein